MEDETKIKTVFPVECPCCNETFYLGVQTAAPVVHGIQKTEDAKVIKNQAIKRITDLDIRDEVKAEALVWLASEDTIIFPDDIDPLIDEMKKNYDNPEEATS